MTATLFENPEPDRPAKKPKRRQKRKGRKNTIARSRLLENSISALRVLGFHYFKNNKKAETAHNWRGDRYIIGNYQHQSLYGTKGRKEAYIRCGSHEYIFEAKLQNSNGSTDEKLPHVLASALASPIPNWIVRLDGNFWTKNERGRAGVGWLRQQSVPDGRHLYIVSTEDEFVALVGEIFKGSEQ